MALLRVILLLCLCLSCVYASAPTILSFNELSEDFFHLRPNAHKGVMREMARDVKELKEGDFRRVDKHNIIEALSGRKGLRKTKATDNEIALLLSIIEQLAVLPNYNPESFFYELFGEIPSIERLEPTQHLANVYVAYLHFYNKHHADKENKSVRDEFSKNDLSAKFNRFESFYREKMGDITPKAPNIPPSINLTKYQLAYKRSKEIYLEQRSNVESIIDAYNSHLRRKLGESSCFMISSKESKRFSFIKKQEEAEWSMKQSVDTYEDVFFVLPREYVKKAMVGSLSGFDNSTLLGTDTNLFVHLSADEPDPLNGMLYVYVYGLVTFMLE